jgi:hypothetical protein
MTSLHGHRTAEKIKQIYLAAPPAMRSLAKPGLSRADRVIAFLEMLPITKGILVEKMKLLPGQREFKGDLRPLGRWRKIRLP